MKKVNQKGFGAIVVIGIFVLVGVIVAALWYVTRSNKTVDSSTKINTTTSPETTTANDTTKKEPFQLPEGYTTHTDSDTGIMISYPANWGSLAPPTASMPSYTKATSYIDKISVGESLLNGYFGYKLHDIKGFTIPATKYGATVAPTKTNEGYIWNVTEVTLADAKEKVGDVYKVNTTMNASGVTLYDFSWQDEGATNSRFLFEIGDKFVVVSLPPVLREFMDPVPATDIELYNTITKNIKNSIQLTN